MQLFDLPAGQVDPRYEPFRSQILVAPDHVESGTGRLLARETAASQNAISGKYAFAPGDVVYSKIRPYLRKATLVTFLGLCSADMYPFRPRNGTVPRFLLELVLGEAFSRFADVVSMRSGFPKINREELAEFVALVPPEAEQVRIAQILDALDDVIRSTEQIIAKLEVVKRGLLHDLLTRGIDDNGEIRDPERHPERFRDSPLGRIPRVWDATPLGDLLTDGPRNGIFKPASEIGDGTLMVGQLAFTQHDGVDFTATRRARTTTSERSVYGLREGDLLVTRVFAIVGGVGRSVLVPQPPEAAVYESNMMRLRVRGSVLPAWVFLAMKLPAARHHIRAHANASNQASINRGSLNSLPCPVAPPHEQREAMRRFDALETRLTQEQAALTKIRLLKKGLSEDLLTGRVRVVVGMQENR